MKKPYTAEYRNLSKEDMATKTILKTGKSGNGSIRGAIELYHLTEGYCLAGSCARYQEKEVWGVQYPFDNARHGRMYHTRQEAEEYFTRLTFLR